MEEKKQEMLSCEEIIEKLKREFPTVKFRPGTVGFMVERNGQGVVFPYEVFNDPNFGHIMIHTVTILEVGQPGVVNERPY